MSVDKKTGFTMKDVCLSYISKARFYTVILSKIVKVPYKGVDTAGVGFNQYGKLCLVYNPDFVASCTLAEAQGLVEHECNHIILKHLQRFPMKSTGVQNGKPITVADIKKIMKDQEDNWILNVGCDMAINQYIQVLPTYKANDPAVLSGQKKVGESMGFYPKTYNFPEKESADVYIALLRKKVEEDKKNNKNTQQKQQCQTCKGSKLAPPQQQQGQGQQQPQQGQQGQQGQQQQGQNGQPQQGQGQGQQDPNQQGQGQQGQGQGQPQFGPAQQGNQPCPDCNGTGEQGMPQLDSHDMWSKVVILDENGEVQSIGDIDDFPDIDPEQECETVVKKAIKECKDWGKIPAHIMAEIEKMKEVKRHDWRKSLRVFVNTVLTPVRRRSQKRVDRRLATIVEYIEPGKKKTRKPKVLYVRDTSGSQWAPEVQKDINNELMTLRKRCDVFVADVDTKVQQYFKLNSADDIKPFKGGGGTDFRPAFELARKLNVDGIIYATDTYGDFPTKEKIGKFAGATIWLTFGMKEVAKKRLPFGKHVDIDPAEYAGKKRKIA